MKLITTGCSFAVNIVGEIDPNSVSWTSCLENIVQPDKTIRLGKDSAALDYMYRSIIDVVIDNLHDDLIVVVGWTSINRWEKFTDKFGSFDIEYAMSTYLDETFWKPTPKFFFNDICSKKSYKQYMLNYSSFQEHLKKLHLIIMLAGFLKSHNIKYVFFNAFEPLDGWKKGTGYYDKSETGEDCPILDKLTNYIKENVNFLEQTQIEIGAKGEHTERVRIGNYDRHDKSYPYTKKEYFIDDGWHPSELAHKEWSKVLNRELNKRWEL